MGIKRMKVSLMEHTNFLKRDGTFDMQAALLYQGKIGGICYSESGLETSFQEPLEKTNRRILQTTSGEHQSIFEHVSVGLYLQNVPKFINMTLNDEQQYSTSERSLRYTIIDLLEPSLTSKEVELYQKWITIFRIKIKESYPGFSENAVEKLAQENARYLTSTFIATEMVHTLPLVQLNRVATYIRQYIETAPNDSFKERLAPLYQEFLDQLEQLHVLDPKLQSNRKHRSLKIFGSNLDSIKEDFGQTYCTTYEGSYAQLAQVQRHRTTYYQMERNQRGFYLPPILKGDPVLVNEWYQDMELVRGCFPQGELVTINEQGNFDTFVLKLKERECAAAQLEINQQTTITKNSYYNALLEKGSDYAYLVKKMAPYMHGQRCTFPDYDCPTLHHCKHPSDRAKQLRKI